jgi:hypothetical protein
VTLPWLDLRNPLAALACGGMGYYEQAPRTPRLMPPLDDQPEARPDGLSQFVTVRFEDAGPGLNLDVIKINYRKPVGRSATLTIIDEADCAKIDPPYPPEPGYEERPFHKFRSEFPATPAESFPRSEP